MVTQKYDYNVQVPEKSGIFAQKYTSRGRAVVAFHFDLVKVVGSIPTLATLISRYWHILKLSLRNE